MLPEISRSMVKNSLVLAAFAAITVAVVAITQQSTETRIAEAERAAQIRALAEQLVPQLVFWRTSSCVTMRFGLNSLTN